MTDQECREFADRLRGYMWQMTLAEAVEFVPPPVAAELRRAMVDWGAESRVFPTMPRVQREQDWFILYGCLAQRMWEQEQEASRKHSLGSPGEGVILCGLCGGVRRYGPMRFCDCDR